MIDRDSQYRDGSSVAVSAFHRLIDPKLGVIRSVTFLKPLTHDPQVYAAYSEPCDTRPLAGIKGANRGGACAVSKERAFVRSCGEAVERYCSTFFDLGQLRMASEAELTARGERFVSIHELYPFSAHQRAKTDFPFDIPNSRSKMRWVPGRGERTKDTVWIPASAVYVPYQFDRRQEPFTHMPISTGLAAGESRQQCVEKGVLEVLERDALMITWNCRIPAPCIDVHSCRRVSSEIDCLLHAEEVTGGKWYFNLITLDIEVPIVTAMLINERDIPLTSFGVSASLDPLLALRNAMEESLLSRVLLHRGKELIQSRLPSCHTDRIRTLRQHLLMHAVSRELSSELSVFMASPHTLSFSEVRERFLCADVARPVTHLAGCEEPVSYDVTTEDIRELGLSVVRTIIPKMQPLDNDHSFRHLGGTRLYSVPVAMGCGEMSEEMINPAPHPFP